MATPLTGLIAAVHTPMKADGALNLELVPRIVARLAEEGVSGLFVCGTTGESASLTVPERRAVAEAYVAAAKKQLPVVVHVGHNTLAEARGLTAHANEIGAFAVGAAPPSYFKPASPEALADCCAEIAAEAPDLPFYYYHIPSMAGVDPDIPSFVQAVVERVPNFAGLKFTSERLDDYHWCTTFDGGRLNVLFGRDEMLLAGLALGAKGAIGSTYCYAAPLYRRLWDAFDRGDLKTARREQARSVLMIQILRKYGGPRASKTFMKLVGLDHGPVRLPLLALSEAEEGAMKRELEEIGFFEF
jgi:N-acetylneuraminate lyase